MAPPLPPPPPGAERAARERYLRAHAIDIYDRVTESRRHFVRADELCRRAAAAFPELLPSDAELAAEAPRLQKDKRGVEIDQGLFLSAVLADPMAGTHLCHAMLLPLSASQARLAEFQRSGALELGGARIERQGKAAIVTMTNPRFLNAEDESTLVPLESAIDLALLDPQTDICVLRGGVVEHPRYAGKRLFGAGINLTHLYQGKIRYLWYLLRDLGLVNKLYRGVALPDVSPEVDCREKLWIGAIARTVEKRTGSGVVSAAGNRRAFRISEEPLDSFRRYMSVYAREQAHCHFSPALIANLERNWNAASRRA